MSASVFSTGGNGGKSTNGGNGGAAGNSYVEVNASGSNFVLAYAASAGGFGGLSNGGTNGTDGTAEAIASATTTTGGYAAANATVAGNRSNNVLMAAIAESTIGTPSSSTVVAHTGVGTAFPGSTPPVGAGAYANGVLSPLAGDLTALQNSNPNNIAAFGPGGITPDVIAIGTLGANNLSNSPEDFISQLNFAFNYPTAIDLGLLNPIYTGNGFDTLEFTVVLDSNTVIDEQFSDLASALIYFNDQVLSLSDAGIVTIGLETRSSVSGDSFAFNLEAAAVPESSTTNVAILGVVLLALQAVRKWRQRRVVMS